MKTILLILFSTTAGYCQQYNKIGYVNPPTPVMTRVEFEKELKQSSDTTAYRPGFQYTAFTVAGVRESITLLRWIDVAKGTKFRESHHRWKVRSQLDDGRTMEYWTDDYWISEATKKK